MKSLMFFLMLFFAMQVGAQTELSELDEVRYHALIQELRCLVCQNQNLAESNAPLAQDLKQQVSEMLLAGKSDTEIKDYLIARYGDFVLYRPPFKPLTWLLWLGPFVLLGFGLFIAWRMYSGSDAEVSETVDKSELERLLKSSNTSQQQHPEEKQ